MISDESRQDRYIRGFASSSGMERNNAGLDCVETLEWKLKRTNLDIADSNCWLKLPMDAQQWNGETRVGDT